MNASQVIELLARGLGAQRRSALIWGAALVVLAVSVVSVWPSMRDSGSLESITTGLSPEMAAALGLSDYASPAGFLNGNLYAILLPLLFGALAIMSMNALTAADEDAGRLELLLALPVSRTATYLGRFAAVVAVLLLVSLAVALTVGLTAPALDMDLGTSGLVGVSLGLLLLGVLHAALVLALAGWGLRSGSVLAVAFGVLALGYLLHAFAPMVADGEAIARVSPWHWALGSDPLVNGVDGAGLALLGGVSVLLVVVGLVGVTRRTIRNA